VCRERERESDNSDVSTKLFCVRDPNPMDRMSGQDESVYDITH